jgi:hypothetical protein
MVYLGASYPVYNFPLAQSTTPVEATYTIACDAGFENLVWASDSGPNIMAGAGTFGINDAPGVAIPLEVTSPHLGNINFNPEIKLKFDLKNVDEDGGYSAFNIKAFVNAFSTVASSTILNPDPPTSWLVQGGLGSDIDNGTIDGKSVLLFVNAAESKNVTIGVGPNW